MRIYVDVKEKNHAEVKKIARQEKKNLGCVYDEALEMRIKKGAKK